MSSDTVFLTSGLGIKYYNLVTAYFLQTGPITSNKHENPSEFQNVFLVLSREFKM